MIDTHAHLDFPEFEEDRDEVIARAFSFGPAHIASQNKAGRVKAIINVGVDPESSQKSIELAEKYDRVFASVGFHPEYFTKKNWGDKDNLGNIFEELKGLALHEKVVAIGECGFDYYHVTRNTQHETQELERIKENQKKGFLAQIEIAKELDLPVIVHCRNASVADSADLGEEVGERTAWEDIYEIISNFKFQISNQAPNQNSQISKVFQSPTFPFPDYSSGNSSKSDFSSFVLHCYSGSARDTEKFLGLPNVFFSFSGNITYPKPVEKARGLTEAVRMIPLERLMLDSDSPFLSPQEFRGKRNEPINIRYIAQKIAEIKNIGISQVEKITDQNAIEFFRLQKG